MTSQVREESNLTTPRTTGEVLERLQRLGLYVTPTMIADDTTAHYLPERETAYRGRDGASGSWEPWMERRAERLYRLRALDRRSGHGPSGSVLRLFLFLSDGWGWEYVRETCIQGYRITVRHAMRGTKNRLRGKPLTVQNLRATADDIAEEQYKPQDPNQAQIDRVKMTLGLVGLGFAPDDRMGTMEWITADLVPDADPSALAEHKQLGPLLWSMLAASESEAITILQGDIAQELIRRALHTASNFRWRVRALFRRKVGTQRVNGKRPSVNPLTFFGAATDYRFQKMLRQMPIRATPAQYLGGQVSHSIIIAYREEQAAKLYEFSMKCLAYWLNTEECAQWIRKAESEINKQH